MTHNERYTREDLKNAYVTLQRAEREGNAFVIFVWRKRVEELENRLRMFAIAESLADS